MQYQIVLRIQNQDSAYKVVHRPRRRRHHSSLGAILSVKPQELNHQTKLLSTPVFVMSICRWTKSVLIFVFAVVLPNWCNADNVKENSSTAATSTTRGRTEDVHNRFLAEAPTEVRTRLQKTIWDFETRLASQDGMS